MTHLVGARIDTPWPFANGALFPFDSLFKVIQSLSPTMVDVEFESISESRSKIRLTIALSTDQSNVGVEQFKQAIDEIGLNPAINCLFEEPPVADIARKNAYAQISPELMTLPSRKEIAVSVPCLDLAKALIGHTGPNQLIATYRAIFRHRAADPVSARLLVPALAELSQRQTVTSLGEAVQDAFNILRNEGWSVVEMFGVERHRVTETRDLIERSICNHLVARFPLLPKGVWTVVWDENISNIPSDSFASHVSRARTTDYLMEVFAKITPSAPMRRFFREDGRIRTTTNRMAASEPFVFVSYCHIDSTFATTVAAYLQSLDIACWYDTSIAAGSVWDETLEGMIRDAFAFIACVSENYQDSRMCRREIKYADSLGKSIVPVSQTEWAWGEGLRMMFQELQVLDLNQGAELPRLGVVVRRLLHA